MLQLFSSASWRSCYLHRLTPFVTTKCTVLILRTQPGLPRLLHTRFHVSIGRHGSHQFTGHSVMSKAAKSARVGSSPLRKRAGVAPIRLLALGTAATSLWGLANASTSLPSSSTGEVCLDETAACYDSPSCWDCVAQFEEDSLGFCQERYPVLADAGASDCDKFSALFCCSFDVSDLDCAADAVTVDYMRCGLEESGCTFSESVCFSAGGAPNRAAVPDDPVPATPAPIAADDPPTTPPIAIPSPTPIPSLPPTGIPPSPPSFSPIDPKSSPPSDISVVETEPPTLSPTAAPVRPLTTAPVPPLTTTPVLPPTAAPVFPPTQAPVLPSTLAPTSLSTIAPDADTASPTANPTASPKATQTSSPIAMATVAPSSSSSSSSSSSATSSDSGVRGIGLTPAPVAAGVDDDQDDGDVSSVSSSSEPSDTTIVGAAATANGSAAGVLSRRTGMSVTLFGCCVGLVGAWATAALG